MGAGGASALCPCCPAGLAARSTAQPRAWTGCWPSAGGVCVWAVVLVACGGVFWFCVCVCCCLVCVCLTFWDFFVFPACEETELVRVKHVPVWFTLCSTSTTHSPAVSAAPQHHRLPQVKELEGSWCSVDNVSGKHNPAGKQVIPQLECRPGPS